MSWGRITLGFSSPECFSALVFQHISQPQSAAPVDPCCALLEWHGVKSGLFQALLEAWRCQDAGEMLSSCMCCLGG